MHYFGDNFVTLEVDMDFNEYWYSSSVASDSQIDYRLLLKCLELEWTWKFSSRAQSNFQCKVTPK